MGVLQRFQNFGLSLLLVMSAFLSAASEAEFLTPDLSFRAVVEIRTPDFRLLTALSYQNGMEKREMLVGKHLRTMITRPDRGRAYILNSGDKTYVDLPLAGGEGFSDHGEAKQRLEFLLTKKRLLREDNLLEETGEEMVNGEKTKVYVIRREGKPPGNIWGQVWINEEGLVIRFYGQEKASDTPPKRENAIFSWEMSKIERGEMSPSIFEPPADYTRQGLEIPSP